MNKKYKMDSDGNLIVITDTEEVVHRKDKYTESTDQILSLENVIESLKKKQDYFEEELGILKKEHKDVITNIVSYSISCFIILLFLTLIYSLLSITVLMIFIYIFALSFISTLIPDILKLINDNKEIKEYTRKINIESHKIKKINKRIEMLSKDKQVIKQETDNRIDIDKIDDYIDVKPISNYYDSTDYFLMDYIINKNTQKENPSKKKVRKLTKEDNRIYKI